MRTDRRREESSNPPLLQQTAVLHYLSDWLKDVCFFNKLIYHGYHLHTQVILFWGHMGLLEPNPDKKNLFVYILVGFLLNICVFYIIVVVCPMLV